MKINPCSYLKNDGTCGDFNLNLLRSEYPATSKCSNLIYNLALIPFIIKLARIWGSLATLIDNMLVSFPFEFISGVLPPDVFDHLPQFHIIENFYGRSSMVKFRLINDQLLSLLQSDLRMQRQPVRSRSLAPDGSFSPSGSSCLMKHMLMRPE